MNEKYIEGLTARHGLDVFYAQQFIQGEKVSSHDEGKVCCFYLEFTPVCPGTVTATVKSGDKTIQTFIANADGKLTFAPMPWTTAIEGEIEYTIGKITLQFNEPIVKDQVTLEVNYEYSMDRGHSVTDVLGILFGHADHLFITNRDMEGFASNFVSLDAFSPSREVDGHLFFYRILCYDVMNDRRLRGPNTNPYATIAQKLFAVDAWFEMYDICAFGGYAAPSMKLLFQNNPQKPKPTFISHDDTKPAFERATDS